MPGEADPLQVEETNIELQVNANSQGNTTQCEPLKDFVCLFEIHVSIYLPTWSVCKFLFLWYLIYQWVNCYKVYYKCDSVSIL